MSCVHQTIISHLQSAGDGLLRHTYDTCEKCGKILMGAPLGEEYRSEEWLQHFGPDPWYLKAWKWTGLWRPTLWGFGDEPGNEPLNK